MLSLAECLDFSGLTSEELDIICEHEHVPDIVAAELGSELLRTPRGIYRLHMMFLEVLERAKLSGHRDKARRIDRAYTRFRANYPLPRLV